MTINVSHVTKSYGGTTILHDISFSQETGQAVSIIGPSGSGKTTLLRCLNFLERAQGGTLDLDGTSVDLAHATHKEIRAVRSQTAMVFQSYNLFVNLTALDNVTEALVYAKRVPRKQANERGLELLNKVGLADRAKSYPSELSGGQKQRVGIARALAVNPKLLLLDEPTSALDPELVGEVETTIEQLAADGQTLLIVTHEMELARRISHKTIFMEAGRIVEQGDPAQLFDDPREERTREFLSRYTRNGR